MSNYVHLNVKSEYTLLNSILKTKDLINEVKGFDKKIVAVTDLNSMYNTYHFEQSCKKAGVHPIIGVSFSIKYEDDFFGNITLLAKNITGYKNLVKLSTIANKGAEHTGKNGFAYLPISELKFDGDTGLICLTGGTCGAIFKYYEKGHLDKIDELLKLYINIFGVNNVYFEMQLHGILEEERLILDENVRHMIHDLEIDVVATNDCYYLKKEHAEHREYALKMNPNPAGIEFYSNIVMFGDEWYLKTPEEMEELFQPYLSIWPNIIENTSKIADMCNASVPVEQALPEFPIPDGYDEESYLRHLAYEGFHERFDGRDDIDVEVYKERLEYEIDVIKKMGFIDYHIITADFIQWAKDDKVYQHPEKYFPKSFFPDYNKLSEKLWKKDYEILVGPGRGSAAGSLLCYCLKITNLDPIKDGLLFERFLNVERVSMPDIDVDFPNAYRYDVVEYVQGKYGYEKVSQIATFQTLGVKSIIKALGKQLNIPYSDTNEMTKNVPEKELVEEENEEGVIILVEKKIELLSQLEKYEYFKNLINTDESIKELFDKGKILEGLPSSTGKHAAGVIIGRKNLMNYCPLMEVDGVMVTQFEKKAAESIGLLKMDFLGLQTLDILAETLSLVKSNYNKTIHLDEIPLNDKYTFETIFQTGNTGKIFQFESSGMKKLLQRMKPTCMADLCAANAAYRPGPLQFIDEFIEGRNNPSSIKYPTKEYESIAKETMGILFYQEQIMQIVQAMAGFTLGEADVLRRGIGKKEKKYIDEGRELFVKGCLKLGTADEKLAKQIYSTIEKFANYGFNKSHSDAYGLVAYLCGYLKAYYPECFMAANLTISSHDVLKLGHTLSETKKMNIDILPPDVRYSSEKFCLENIDGKFSIRFSLAAIKSIREENASAFAKAKDKSSLYGFLLSVPQESLRKNQLINLIYSGAFDYLGTRKNLVENLGRLLDVSKFVNGLNKKHIPSCLNFITPKTIDNSFEFQKLDLLKKEKDCIQIALSGHPVSVIRNLKNNFYTISDLKSEEVLEEMNGNEVEIPAIISSKNEIMTKKQEHMCFCVVEDEFAGMEGIIFPRDYKKLKETLDETEEMPVMIKGKIQKKILDNEEVSANIIISSIEKVVKATYSIYIDASNVTDELSKKLSSYNGITSVIFIDTKSNSVKYAPYSIDFNHNIINLLNKNNIRFIVKK